MTPKPVMEVRLLLMSDGNVIVGGVQSTLEDVCIANLMLDRAKATVQNIKVEVLEKKTEEPNG